MVLGRCSFCQRWGRIDHYAVSAARQGVVCSSCAARAELVNLLILAGIAICLITYPPRILLALLLGGHSLPVWGRLIPWESQE